MASSISTSNPDSKALQATQQQPQEAILSSGIDDILYPDNPKRTDRLKNLAANLQQIVIDLKNQGQEFTELLTKLKSDIGKFKESIEKLKTMTPKDNKELIDKLTHIVEQIDAISANKTINIGDSPAVLIPKYILEIIASTWGGTVIGRSATRYIENMLLDRMLAQHIAENGMRAGFLFRAPRWARFAGGSIGFIGGAAIAAAIELATAGITGAITRSSLQNLIGETLDGRFEAKAAQMASMYSIKSLRAVESNVHVFHKIIDKANEAYVNKEYDKANTFIDLIGIDDVVKQWKEDVEKITEQKVLDELAKTDQDKWKDKDIEDNWTPPKPESTKAEPDPSLGLRV